MKTAFKLALVSMIILTPIVATFTLPIKTTGGSISDSMTSNNLVVVRVQRADGFEEYRQTHNVFTNIGKNATIAAFTGVMNIPNGARFLELSTSSATPVSGQSVCPSPVTGNGLDISVGTVTLGAGCATLACAIGNASITKTWTATGTQNNIQTVCLGNSSSSAAANSLMAYALFSPPVNLGPGDQLTVTYYPSFNATG